MTEATARPVRAALTALGCKVNFAEMAELAGALAAAGIEVVAEEEPADVRVLNSCTVTLQADATSRQRLRRLRRADPDCHLVLTGCSVDGNPQMWLRTGTDGSRLAVAGADAVFANADKERIGDHVIALAAQLRPRSTLTGAAPPWLGRSRAFLKVQDGCAHRCTYCSVWAARGGRSRSVPAAEVVARAHAAADAGHGELVLTGVDLGAWGRDLSPRSSLANLVETLLDSVDARLRLSSVNANDVGERLAGLTSHPRLCSHWHLPLQSGSDAVLRAMHRGYRSARYRRVVGWLRAADPDTELTNDVMVGFPGETEADHRATVDLIGELEMLHCHVFRWSPRPGTPAAGLPGRVGDDDARRRSREVRRAAVQSGILRRQRMVGRDVEVVWESRDGGAARGLDAGWHTVAVDDAPDAVPGRLATVIVTAVDGDVLRGRTVRA